MMRVVKIAKMMLAAAVIAAGVGMSAPEYASASDFKVQEAPVATRETDRTRRDDTAIDSMVVEEEDVEVPDSSSFGIEFEWKIEEGAG